MVRAIKAKLEDWSSAIFINHNSMKVGENFFRQALYQTLHSPYLTNTNGNCRSDSLRMVQGASLFTPGILSIPVDKNGTQILILDRLARANGFNNHVEQDTMTKVESTIHLCRILATEFGDQWSNFLRFSQKAAVLEFVSEEDIFSISDFFFGKGYTWVVTRIGSNPDNPSELLAFNLAVDPDNVAFLSDSELETRLKALPKPIRSLRANASPLICAYEDVPPHLLTNMLGESELRRRAARLKHDPFLSNRLKAAFLAIREQKPSSPYAEQQIYDGFSSREDQALMDQFHGVSWADRIGVLHRINDLRLKPFGERLIYFEAPHALPESLYSNLSTSLSQRIIAPPESVPWLTLPKALLDTTDRLATANGAEAALLRDFRDFLFQRAENAAAISSDSLRPFDFSAAS